MSQAVWGRRGRNNRVKQKKIQAKTYGRFFTQCNLSTLLENTERVLLEVIYTSRWHNCPRSAGGWGRAEQARSLRVSGLQGKSLGQYLSQAMVNTPLSTGPFCLRKNFLPHPDSVLKSSKVCAEKSTPPTSSPHSEPMEPSGAYFSFATRLQKCLWMSHLLIAKGKAMIVGWSIAENDNTEMLRLQDLEVI